MDEDLIKKFINILYFIEFSLHVEIHLIDNIFIGYYVQASF